MGCFLTCFGADSRSRRMRRRHSPSRPQPPPPRRDHVGLVGKAPVAAALVVKEEKISTPPTEQVAEEVVTGSSSGKELRELTKQKASPVRSLLPAPEEQVTPPLSPEEGSPVVAAAAPTPDPELRELGEQANHSSGKKKVTFDMNVITYENATVPDEEEETTQANNKIADEDVKPMQKALLYPENHRYQNCADSDDDGDGYSDDGAYDEEEEDEDDEFADCEIDMVDEEEMSTEENKQESQESLFSLPMAKDQQNNEEVSSPAPKSSGSPLEEPSPVIQGNNPRDRRQYVRPVLNPVQNMSQWKEVKAQTAPIKKLDLDKENVNSVTDAGVTHTSGLPSRTKMNPSEPSKKEVSVDASLSTWLASSGNSTVDKAQSKSPCSVSSVSRDERPVLGALTVDDLKQSSVTSSPRRSPACKCDETPILGTVGSYWSCTSQRSVYCSSRSESGTNGIPNTTSKYSEARKVNWHSTPFDVRLDRALKKTAA